MDAFDPRPEDKFSFGLWTVGNPGRDPFGGPVRPTQDPCDIVRGLARCGAWGVNLHDEDLVPFGASARERDDIVARFQATLDETGIVVPMATTNLFSHPIFKDGAFTANDPRVRAFALRKTMEAIDLGVELGARIYVFWGGREGAEADACRDPQEALKRFRGALDFLCAYVDDQGYDLRFALEAKPNEPRCDMYLPTTGHMLHFIETLERSAMVGVNPEVAHETMAGLSFTHGVAQAMEAGKLFHIDLNAQRIGRYDQDLRFGSEDLKQAFLLVRLLEGTAGNEAYEGPRHFDAHAYRSEDIEGVWDFARGCMRTYNILRERARAFDADSEVAELCAQPLDPTLDSLLAGGYDAGRAEALRGVECDVDAIAQRGLRYERLDQLMMEHLMGVRP
ncbi:MAG: xylose isomerase [Planctomycetota bacterium]|jgi:xylose isomerase|nr:xylose isomerase [Planctomycetota bacterium]MDP6761857.1 xylose isomerase [Planctomycetota bacterium]MDP6988903.1 xylose isomerase [Planctomycetota bacterium]